MLIPYTKYWAKVDDEENEDRFSSAKLYNKKNGTADSMSLTVSMLFSFFTNSILVYIYRDG